MRSLFPALLDPRDVAGRRVLVIAPHADDEVLGAGGMLAVHTERGDAVRVVILSDGVAGDPESLEQNLAEVRRAESRAAGEVLGVTDYRFLELPDGGLANLPDLAARIGAELEEFGPELVYGPGPNEMHADHRAAARALVEAAASGPECQLHLYGVNAQAAQSVLYNTTAWWPKKAAALACFASQLQYHDLVAKARTVDAARTINVPDTAVELAEGFTACSSREAVGYERRARALLESCVPNPESTPMSFELPAATAVISTWNKAGDVLENLAGLKAQEHPFAEIVVVDNCSSDDTVSRIRAEHPDVRVVVMPNSDYGACETFNIGFACVTTPLLAILDDDVVLPPDWLAKALPRLMAEPNTTAVLSTKVVEPEMPESYKNSVAINTERYMSTFRGCGSLAWTDKLREAEYYDERLFIYGNERDLTCRLLNLGYRVLQYPEVETFHKTPFGVQMGKRSLYFHARNAWLCQLKYAPLGDLLKLPWLVLTKVLLRGSDTEVQGEVSDATGTIGIGKSIRATPGAWWVLTKAGLNVLANVPYCLKHRQPVTAPDFELPIS